MGGVAGLTAWLQGGPKLAAAPASKSAPYEEVRLKS
jgi:hypothetical protein